MKTWLLNQSEVVQVLRLYFSCPSMGFLAMACSQFLPGKASESPGQEFYIEITSAVSSHPEISASVGEKKEATVVPWRSKLGLDSSRMFTSTYQYHQVEFSSTYI